MKLPVSLLPGESAIAESPVLPLNSEDFCIPQHFLRYQHTIESIESIVLDIEYSARFPIFVSHQDQQIYIQVGIIGRDNYPSSRHNSSVKIVYGRKWRVENELPSSEVIQSAFLALQKAREHEVRELFRLRTNKHRSAPYSGHQDIPLLVRKASELKQADCLKPLNCISEIKSGLSQVEFDETKLELLDAIQLKPEKWLLEIKCSPTPNSTMAELKFESKSIVIEKLSQNTLFASVLDLFITISNQHVESHFTYKGFNRFSREISVAEIGELSVKTRRLNDSHSQTGFSKNLELANYQTDLSRAPALSDSQLSNKLRSQLIQFNVTEGILPKSCG